MNLLDDWGIVLQSDYGDVRRLPLRDLVNAVLKDEQAGELLREMLFPQKEYRVASPDELVEYKIDERAEWTGAAAVLSLTEDSGL